MRTAVTMVGVASAREAVEEFAPHLGADWRFRIVEEDPGKWGFVKYESETAVVVVSVHHSGQHVDVFRKDRLPHIVESVHAVEVYLHLERELPSWTEGVGDELRYIDRHLDDVVRLTATEDTWDKFRADARTLLSAPRGN